MKKPGIRRAFVTAGSLLAESLSDGRVLNTRVRASLSTSLTSLLLVAWFGAIPKRWFSEAP